MRSTATSRRVRFLSLACLTLAGGCATVTPHAGFDGLARDVKDRGAYDVRWNVGGPADAEAAARVERLLAAPLTIDAAVQVALLNNRHLQADYESLGIAQADLVQAGLLRNPVFDGSVRFVEGGGSPTIDLGVAFDFLDVFFVGLRKRVAAAEFAVVRTRLTARVLAHVGATKVAFLSLQAAEQRLGLARQIEAATAASAAFAERLRAAGNNRPIDLAQQQALHEESLADLDAAAEEADAARERLARLMGVADAARLTPGGPLPDPPAGEPAFGDVAALATANSLALAAARQDIDVGLARLGVARPFASDLGASAERDNGQWEVGPALVLTLPVFDQGQPAIARARSGVRAARERYAAMRIDVASAAREAAARAASLRLRVDRYRAAVLPLRARIVSDMQLQYNAMQVGTFELLQAKRDDVTAAGAYLSLLRDYWIARTRLELGTRGGADFVGIEPDAAATRQ